MRLPVILLAALAVLALAAPAHAQASPAGGGPEDGNGQRVADRDDDDDDDDDDDGPHRVHPHWKIAPNIPHPSYGMVIHIPTATLATRDSLHASAGVDHRAGTTVRVAASFAGLAELDLEATNRLAADAWLGIATFKLAAPADAWFPGQPGLALGVRRSFAPPTDATPDLAELFVVASAELGPVRLHAGASAAAIAGPAPSTGATVRLPTGTATPIRPLAGLEWTPAQFPRTTVMGDFGWQADLTSDTAELRWVGGWGVRFQALAWGAIELAVRHRDRDNLAGSTVLVRVLAVLPVPEPQ